MKKLLLVLATMAAVGLSGCGLTPESRAKAVMKTSQEILVAGTVELRDVKKVDGTVCGLVSYEAVGGRTDFRPFLVLNTDQLYIVTPANFMHGNGAGALLYTQFCGSTIQYVQ